VFLFHRFARAQAIAYALNNLAWVARADGDLEQARATLDDALARFRRLRDRPGEALTLAHLGNLSRSLGDFGAARAHLEDALRIRSDLGDRRAMLSTRIGLGLVAMTAGDAAAGRALLSAALAQTEAVDDLPAMACVQTNWAIGEERRRRARTRSVPVRGRLRAAGPSEAASAPRRGAAWRCTTSAWRSATRPVPRRRCSVHARSSSPSATRAGGLHGR
jgi:tetratricopeptide (TPR) repeat protein